jgi:hypothetical protein
MRPRGCCARTGGRPAPAGAATRFVSAARRRAAALVAILCLASTPLVGLPTLVLGGERWEGLQGLPRVAVDVTVSPNHPDLVLEDVRRRVEDGVRRGQPAPVIETGSAERLHLTVGVRAYSSSELRGFYLPLSQAYGIGPVRLVLERPAQVSGLGAPIAVQVWHAERQAKAAWRHSAAEILELTDELIAAFLLDYQRAQAK